jgi:hypothetical protein
MTEAKTTRVEIEHADGTIIRLTGDEAHKWGEYVNGTSGYLFAHGMQAPLFQWEEFRKKIETK